MVDPPVESFDQVADGLANSCGGVLRGQGRQHLGAAFNLIAYYVLALPLGISLAFKFGQGDTFDCHSYPRVYTFSPYNSF